MNCYEFFMTWLYFAETATHDGARWTVPSSTRRSVSWKMTGTRTDVSIPRKDPGTPGQSFSILFSPEA